jgi:predicted amidohydrolase
MPLKAGVVHFSPLYGRVVDNLDRLETLVAEACRQGAELLVLPEMAWTGYLWPNVDALRPYAEKAGSGRGQERLSEWARRWSVTLVCGFPEADGDSVFNSQAFFSPDGAPRPVYRKTHLFEADQWWTRPGETGYLQWASPWGPVGSGICMDLNYPDLVEHHAGQGSSVLAFSTNWLDQDFDVLPYWEEQLGSGSGYGGLALFANRGGEEYGVPFRGQSAVFWKGRCLASLPGKADGVLVVEQPTA